MHVELKRVELEEREILANLLEKFDYEFSQYADNDVNKLGLYGYPALDYYWMEESRCAYFILVSGKLAGFAMIYNHREEGEPETDFQISEFFVMYKYRRTGVGKQAFFQLLDRHKGRAGLKSVSKNVTSMRFWDSVVNEYTNGQYEIIKIKSDFPGGVEMFLFDSK